MQDCLCVCSDVNGLMEELGFQLKAEEHRLFIEPSKVRLKTVQSLQPLLLV